MASHLARHKPVNPGRGTGNVTIAFIVSPTGALASVRISRSSGNTALDRVAVASVRRAAPFPPPPEGMLAKDREMIYPLNFR